jgi:hypothetical protein
MATEAATGPAAEIEDGAVPRLVAGLVKRLRLFELLDRGATRPVTPPPARTRR